MARGRGEAGDNLQFAEDLGGEFRTGMGEEELLSEGRTLRGEEEQGL
jgi:hypothetical protein